MISTGDKNGDLQSGMLKRTGFCCFVLCAVILMASHAYASSQDVRPLDEKEWPDYPCAWSRDVWLAGEKEWLAWSRPAPAIRLKNDPQDMQPSFTISCNDAVVQNGLFKK